MSTILKKMTTQQKIEHKKFLLKKCVDIIEKRISSIRLAMEEAQSAANSEEKSSAGDKYETSRAMSHLEKDMQAKQLSANMQELKSILSVDCSKIYNIVQRGSFVDCAEVSFFIAAGLGKINFENESVLFVSSFAPVARLLLGKKSGNRITFNKKEYFIKDVY